jgi:hypothetical protein
MSRKHNNKNQDFIRGRVQEDRSDSGNAWYIQFRIFLPCMPSKISEYILILYCVVYGLLTFLEETILFQPYKILFNYLRLHVSVSVDYYHVLLLEILMLF